MSSVDDIKVSVICLAFNHEKYIEKTLQGFVNQKTTFKYEVLINDDASKDGTKNIIIDYCNRYPDIFVPFLQEENQFSKGVSITRDILLPRAKGKYIAFCEGDDFWIDENKLQMQFEVLEMHPECSLCVHPVNCINEDGSMSGSTIPSCTKGYVEGVLEENFVCKLIWCRGRYPFQTSSYFMRKQALDIWINKETDFGYKMTGDVRYLRLAIKEGMFYYINKYMSNYRMFSIGSWTSSRKEESSEMLISRFINNINNEKLFDELTDYKFHKYITLRVVTSVLAWSDKDPKKAKEILNENNVNFFMIFCNLPIRYSVYYICLYINPTFHTRMKKLAKNIVSKMKHK